MSLVQEFSRGWSPVPGPLKGMFATVLSCSASSGTRLREGVNGGDAETLCSWCHITNAICGL